MHPNLTSSVTSNAKKDSRKAIPVDRVAKSASKMWGGRWGGGEGMKLGVGGASSFRSQMACLCQQQWGRLGFGSPH